MTNSYSGAYAAFYDRYFADWVRAFSPRLAAFLDRAEVPDRSVLDLCCGTGEAAAVLSDAGWTVFGVDRSIDMLARAREKLDAVISAGKVTLLEADATSFALPRAVGACICLDGSLNHLDSVEELRRCFQAVSAALLDGGQVLFDVLEVGHLRHWHQIRVIDEPAAVIVKRGVWDKSRSEGLLRVSGAIGEGPTCARVEQTLRSRAFSADEVIAALAGTGLEPADCDIEQYELPRGPANCGPHAGPCRTFYKAVKRAGA